MNSDNLSLGDMNTLTGEDVLKNSQLLYSNDIIGEYKVIRQLGAGGMGQVYLVENIHIHKQYALKVLPPNLSKNKNFIDRFKIEARVMADLDHPNIVGVHNIGQDKERGLFYLVMEYVDSRPETLDNGQETVDLQTTVNEQQTTNPSDLEQLLKHKKKLDEEYVLRITQQLCSALDYAHNFREKGIVHRDLKPSNILLDAEGNAHIADFGLAKVVGNDYLKSMIDRSMRLTMAGSAGGTTDLSLGDMNTVLQTSDHRHKTADGKTPSTNNNQLSTNGGTAGSLIGTYEYMAPEQQEGAEATVQSDIYSLGLIIYRMLTGRKAKGRFKLPSHFGLSGYWDEIIDRSLEIEPEDRFSSVSEMMDYLPDFKETKPKVNSKVYKREKIEEVKSYQEVEEVLNTESNEAEVEKRTEPDGLVNELKESEIEKEKEEQQVSVNKKSSGLSKSILFILIVILAGTAAFIMKDHFIKKTDKIDNNSSSYSSSLNSYSNPDENSNNSSVYSSKNEKTESDSVESSDYLLSLTKNGSSYYKNDIGMQLAYVSPGSFDMGSNSGDNDEKPVHKVTITKPYLIGRYEVTQSEYEKVIGSNPTEYDKGPNNPVSDVSWYDAVKFCKRLTERERSNGNLRSGYAYRLPTEAEWEFAARGGKKSRDYMYSGSNSISSVGWYEDNSGGDKHPVGKKSSNELGLYDMSGNVWEWCSDWKGSYPSGSVVDPKGPSSGSSRVSRGGSCYRKASSCRVASRSGSSPGGTRSDLGFRVVLASE